MHHAINDHPTKFQVFQEYRFYKVSHMYEAVHKYKESSMVCPEEIFTAVMRKVNRIFIKTGVIVFINCTETNTT